VLLALMAEDEGFVSQAEAQLKEEDLGSPISREFFSFLLNSVRQKKKRSLPAIINSVSDAGYREQLVEALAAIEEAEDKSRIFSDCLNKILCRHGNVRLEELRRLIREAESARDHAGILTYTREYQALLRDIKAK